MTRGNVKKILVLLLLADILESVEEQRSLSVVANLVDEESDNYQKGQ